MKKFYFTAALLLTMAANIIAAPSYKWHKLIDTPSAQDLTGHLTVTTDGNLVSLSHFGSGAERDLSFDGEKIATGAQKFGTADNRNLIIIKHNALTGARIWSVSSTLGDLSASDGGMVATPDGGVVVLLKIRGSKADADAIVPPILKDASTEYDVEGFNHSAWIYNAMLVKIDSDGLIDWYRFIMQDQSKIVSKELTDGISPNAITIDTEGNIYMGGIFRSPMVFTGKKNSVHILSPRNVDGCTDANIANAGGAFIVKLDKDGDFVNAVESAGTLVKDQINALNFSDGKIYFSGTVKGKADDTLSIGGKNVSIPDTNEQIIVGALNTDLNADYLTLIRSYLNTANRQAVYATNIRSFEGKLYVMGRFTGGFSPADESTARLTSTNTMQEGYAIRLNATDGTWENAVRYGSTISDVRNIFMDGNKDIYLCCYRMNATEGITMARWNPTTNELEDKVNLVTGGNAPTCNDAVYSPAGNMIFTAGRGNGAFKFGDITSDAPAGYGAVVSAYSLGTASTVDLMNTPSVSYIGEKGKAVIKASDATKVRMVNAAGIKVYDAEVPAGTTEISAEPGVYSINGNKILVK